MTDTNLLLFLYTPMPAQEIWTALVNKNKISNCNATLLHIVTRTKGFAFRTPAGSRRSWFPFHDMSMQESKRYFLKQTTKVIAQKRQVMAVIENCVWSCRLIFESFRKNRYSEFKNWLSQIYTISVFLCNFARYLATAAQLRLPDRG